LEVFLEEKDIFEGLPGISEYNKLIKKRYDIKITGLENLVNDVMKSTSLNRKKSERIVIMFWQIIRSEALKGHNVKIYDFGNFYIVSPLVTRSVDKIFMKFLPDKSLIKRLNEK
jgi:nucleoid DNA-binding protein